MVIYSMRMYIHKRRPMDRVGWADIQMLRYVLRSGLQSRCNGSGGRGLRPTSFISRLIKPMGEEAWMVPAKQTLGPCSRSLKYPP